MSKRAVILVVEDDLLVANEIKVMLEEADYRVLGPAPSYARAMDLLAVFRPDMALLDITLAGGRSGVELARELLKLHIPALFISGAAPEAADARQAAVGLLFKPIQRDRLLETLELVQEIASGATPAEFPVGFERYDWQPNGNGKGA